VSLTEYAERARRGEPKIVAADSRRLQAKFRQSLIMLKERRGEERRGEERREEERREEERGEDDR
jgi:hypothetical protein